MTPHFPIWSFGPKIESVDGICHQTDSMNIFYLDVKTRTASGFHPPPPFTIKRLLIYILIDCFNEIDLIMW